MNKIIAVDFDGTLCKDRFPEIGEPKREVIAHIKREAARGAKIILFTCRENGNRPLLDEATGFCRRHGIPIHAVNENINNDYSRQYGSGSGRKVYADVYIDDKAINPKDLRRHGETAVPRWALILSIIAHTLAVVFFLKGCAAPSPPTNSDPPAAVESAEPTVYLPELSQVNETPTGWTQNPRPTPTPTAEALFTEADIVAIAQTIYGEAGVVRSDMRRAAVAWVILNRVDSDNPYYPNTILEVIEQRGQFNGYLENHAVAENYYDLALDVLTRWEREKNGRGDVGRVIPKNYLFFTGDGKENYFTREWRDKDNWGWTLPNPYED
jgi:hypothetical protein